MAQPPERWARQRGLGAATGIAACFLALFAGGGSAAAWVDDEAVACERFKDYSAWRAPDEAANPLAVWASKHKTGRVLHKFQHHLEVYHEHLDKFRQRPVVLLALGVQSGGEIGMWQSYFGPQFRFVGVDVNPACKQLEKEHGRTKIYIGDLGNTSFLRTIRDREGPFHMVIDDASHLPPHQVNAFRMFLPAMHAGGVYLVEDLHASRERLGWFTFAAAIGKLLMDKGLDVALRHASDVWAWKNGDFVDFITGYAEEVLRHSGPGSDCSDGTLMGYSREVAANCAPYFLPHSIHFHTDIVAVRLRDDVQVARHARAFGSKKLPWCSREQDRDAVVNPPPNHEDSAPCRKLGIF